jgi:hypothetical protein
MAEEIVRELRHPSARLRVLLARREDGRFTYREQEWLAAEYEWEPPTVDAGVYDSIDTAEAEARQRVGWLRALFH